MEEAGCRDFLQVADPAQEVRQVRLVDKSQENEKYQSRPPGLPREPHSLSDAAVLRPASALPRSSQSATMIPTGSNSAWPR
jgi:hypothetical protein